MDAAASFPVPLSSIHAGIATASAAQTLSQSPLATRRPPSGLRQMPAEIATAETTPRCLPIGRLRALLWYQPIWSSSLPDRYEGPSCVGG